VPRFHLPRHSNVLLILAIKNKLQQLANCSSSKVSAVCALSKLEAGLAFHGAATQDITRESASFRRAWEAELVESAKGTDLSEVMDSLGAAASASLAKLAEKLLEASESAYDDVHRRARQWTNRNFTQFSKAQQPKVTHLDRLCAAACGAVKRGREANTKRELQIGLEQLASWSDSTDLDETLLSRSNVAAALNKLSGTTTARQVVLSSLVRQLTIKTEEGFW
jgi:hypothetical protein